MCNLFGQQQSAAQSTTPAYVPPAQSVTSGPAATSGGVSVKGESRSGAGVNSRVRNSTAEDTATLRRRRSASSGLGL